jgi:predicted secreted protein
MEKLKMNVYYPAILVGLGILVLAGSYVVYHTYLLSEDLRVNESEYPGSPINPTGPGPVDDPGARCDPLFTDSRIAVPANISVAIRDPMPGIRYSLNEGDSGRTIVLANGDVVEINLRWIPGLGFHWIIPVSGCGLELINAGTYSDGGDFWNNTGHYRVRYRAVRSGTSVIDGKFILIHEEKGDLGFNLTVIVK